MPGTVISPRQETAALASNKVIRNTYPLLAITLLFSAVLASVLFFLLEADASDELG